MSEKLQKHGISLEDYRNHLRKNYEVYLEGEISNASHDLNLYDCTNHSMLGEYLLDEEDFTLVCGEFDALSYFRVLTYLRVYFLLPSRNLLNIIISNGFWGWSLRESYFSFGLNLLITKMAMMIMEAEKTVKIIIIPKN